MKNIIYGLFLTFCVMNIYAQDKVNGIVFDDKNQNAILDKGEKGIVGIAVSNGTQVVVTDQNGRYELPATDNMIVFVIKPSGYRVSVDQMNLSRFYYIHKPNGSPVTKYQGSASTGKLPASVDFPLIKYNESNNFNIIVFGDTQPYNDNEIDYLRRGIVGNMTGIKDIAFGTTLGDITGDRPDLFQPVSEVIAQVGVPWYHVIGNHDHNYDTADDKTASESYEAFYGPATYSFNYGKVHFIVADNIIHSLNDIGKAQYVGGLREDQMQFIENDLKQVPTDYLVVFMVHIPFYDEDGETFRHTDRNRIFAALSKFSNTLSMSGHTHYIKQYFFDAKEGWNGSQPHHHLNIGAICGDWWKGILDQYNLPGAMMKDGSPQGYFILRFNNNKYMYDYKAVRYDAPAQISVYMKGENELYANFFAGNQFSKLQYRINDGGWQSMQLALENDPLFSSIRQRWDDILGLPGKIPSRPSISEHLWKANIMKPVRGRIEVMATDMYGRTYTQVAIVQ